MITTDNRGIIYLEVKETATKQQKEQIKMKINFEEIRDVVNNGNLRELSRQTDIPLRTLEDWRYGNSKALDQMEERLTKIQKYINKENEKMTHIKELSWKEFLDLGEVQVEVNPSNAREGLLTYNDDEIQVGVSFKSKEVDECGDIITDSEGHDDQTLWEDEELAKELHELVIEEYESLK